MARTRSPKQAKTGSVWLSLDEWSTKAQADDLPADAAIRHTFDTEIKSMDDDDDCRRMSFVISTAKPDRDRDCVMPDGMKLDAYRKNGVVLWAHDYRSMPVGKMTSIKVDGDRVIAEAEFATADINPMAECVYRALKRKFLNATSIGFRPLKYARNDERGGYDFMEVELLEFSIVPVPANAEALSLAASADGDPVDLTPVKDWIKAIEGAQAKAEVEDKTAINVTVDASQIDAAVLKFEAVAARLEAAMAKTETPMTTISFGDTATASLTFVAQAESPLVIDDDDTIRLSLGDPDDGDTVFCLSDDDADPDVIALDPDELKTELRALFAQELAGPLLRAAQETVARALAEARGQVV